MIPIGFLHRVSYWPRFAVVSLLCVLSNGVYVILAILTKRCLLCDQPLEPVCADDARQLGVRPQQAYGPSPLAALSGAPCTPCAQLLV